jgi:phage shock protein PspC (stress-responsive transcriptional regulator)
MSEQTVVQPAARRLERSRSDRMLAGVSGGLARYFGIHPAFYRVGFVVLALIGGAGILIYLAAALVMPDEGEEDSIASAALRERRNHPLPVIALGIAAVAAAVLLSRVSLWPSGDAAWMLLLIGGGAVFLLTRRRGVDEPAAPAPAAGSAGDAAADAPTVPAAVAPARRGRFWRTLLIVVGSLLALLLITVAVFVAVFPVHLSRGVGNETYVPSSAADLHRSYRLGVGDLFVDLRNVRLPVGETKLTTRVDVGGLRVIVPPGAALRVKADVGLGNLNLFGEANDGRNVDDAVTERGARVLVLDAHVGAGSLRVSRHLP